MGCNNCMSESYCVVNRELVLESNVGMRICHVFIGAGCIRVSPCYKFLARLTIPQKYQVESYICFFF